MISEAAKYQLFTGKQQRLSCFWIGVTCCGRAAMNLLLSHCINYCHLNYLLVPCNQLGTLLHTGQTHWHYFSLQQLHPWVYPAVLIFPLCKQIAPRTRRVAQAQRDQRSDDSAPLVCFANLSDSAGSKADLPIFTPLGPRYECL